MRFTKFGKALCMGALSAGVVFGITSCVQSYSVGYLVCDGNRHRLVRQQWHYHRHHDRSQHRRDDHDQRPACCFGWRQPGARRPDPGQQVSLCSQPRRDHHDPRGRHRPIATARACTSAGTPTSPSSPWAGTAFSRPQETFYTQGLNPFRLIVDTTGSYLMVLDHDAPDNANPSNTDNCALALGTLAAQESTPKTCGDITVFKIDQTTGRLSLVENAQVTAANGSPDHVFPGSGQPCRLCFLRLLPLTLTGAPYSPPPTPTPAGPRSGHTATPAAAGS